MCWMSVKTVGISGAVVVSVVVMVLRLLPAEELASSLLEPGIVAGWGLFVTCFRIMNKPNS